MNGRQRSGAVIAGAAGLLLVLVALLTAPDPQPGFVLPPEVRTFPLAMTPAAAGWVGRSTINDTINTPVPRPTEDPYYPGNYPIGHECQYYLTQSWDTAPDGDDGCAAQPCSTSNIDWTEYDACLATAAGYTVTIRGGDVVSMPVALKIPPRILEEDGSGTALDPYNTEYAPTWFTNIGGTLAFTRTGSVYYNAVDYGDADVLNRLIQFITEAGVRYNDDSNIWAVRVGAGYADELAPTSCDPHDTGCVEKTLLGVHESKVASCAEYRAFVRALVDAAVAAFPNKPIYVGAVPAACANASYDTGHESRLYWWEDATTGWVNVGANVGYSANNISWDNNYVDGWPLDSTTGYKAWTFAETGRDYATPLPLMFEGYRPISGDYWQQLAWIAYAAAGLGGDAYMTFGQWTPYYSTWFWDTAQNRLGGNDDLAWVVPRGQEYSTIAENATTYQSGYRGTWHNHIDILTPEAYNQYCSSSVISAASTQLQAWELARYASTPIAYNTPVARPCNVDWKVTPTPGGPTPTKTATPYLLPAPAATLQATPGADATAQFNVLQRVANRQARRVEAGGQMGVAVDETWSHAGDVATVNVRLIYYDNGTDDFTVRVLQGAGWDDHVIDRVNSQLWQVEEWSVATAYLVNGLEVGAYGTGFLSVVAGLTNPVYVHDLSFEVSDADTPTPSPTPSVTATPTATGSPTVTLTPSRTRTVRPTSTPYTATPTRTPTATPDWPTLNCPVLTPVVDATLSEWAAVTPVTLNRASAAAVQPFTPQPTRTYTPNPTHSPTPTSAATATSTPTPAPSTADAQAVLYCGWAGTTLYFAGTITDDTVTAGTTYSATGALSRGDAVRLTLDGASDGLSVPVAADDHDLYIAPDGRVLDFDTHPLATTVRSVAIAGGWQFELALAADALGITPSAGVSWGLVWGLLDADDGTGLQHILSDRKRKATIP